MKTIKELEIEGKPCKEDDGYLTALSDVLGLIDEITGSSEYICVLCVMVRELLLAL